MSDVAYAPAPSSAPAPAPAANEVPINQNPTNAPAPVGSQAPDKPAGESERPASRREAIQKAFDRANTPERREQTKPAQARPGHNQPPEETKAEKPKPAPINLKKRPTDQEAREAPPRDRAEHGHFAPRQPAPAAPQARNGQQQPGTQQQVRELPADAPHRVAPPRFSERAKAEWHAAPESVRAEVRRMAQEFHRGFETYKNDFQTMNTIRPFQKMATEHGTTLQKALSNYVGMEHKLRSDVVGGLDMIVNNLNLRTPDGHKLGLRDIAWHVLNQTPEQHQLVQSSNAQMAQSHQLAQANERIAGLEKFLQRMQHVQHFNYTRSQVDQYAASHPRLDELADLIETEVKLGFDLDQAYRRAELLRPATHAAQTRTNSTTAQTRTSDRSIHGAPSGPSNGTSRRTDKPVGRRESIANAIKRVNGSL